MTRIRLRDHELRIARRPGSIRGKSAFVIALYDMGQATGTLAIPVALWDDFRAACAALSSADILTTAPPTPSGGEGAATPDLGASGLTAHTAGGVGGKQ